MRIGSLVIRKRYLSAVLAGVFLATVFILFTQLIYSPFMDDVDDVRVLLPPDVDWMIEIREFPAFVKALETGEFYTALDRDENLQDWLKSPEIRGSVAIRQLRDAWRRINDGSITRGLPGSIDLLGDISGERVCVGGFAAAAGADPVVFAAFKPDSWKVIAAANVLMNETLSDRFLSNSGLEIEHRTHVAVVTAPDGDTTITLAIARIENAILVSTDPDALSRRVVRLTRRGLPPIPPGRMTPSWVFDGHEDTAVNIVVRRQFLSRRAANDPGLIAPFVDGDIAGVIDRAMPRADEDDLHMQLALEDALKVRLQIPVSMQRTHDLLTRARDAREESLRAQVTAVLRRMPYDTFFYTYSSTAPGEVLRYLLRQDAVIEHDKRQFWGEEMADRLPRLAEGLDASSPSFLGEMLGREFDRLFEDEAGVALFPIRRAEKIPDATVGVATILRIKDRSGLDDLIDEVDRIVPDSRVFERYDEGRMTLWFVADKRWMDDKELTSPGFAILDGYAVFTNWFPMLRRMSEVIRGDASGFAGGTNIDYSLSEFPSGLRLYGYLDATSLYAYFDQSVDGWVRARAAVTDLERIVQRQNFEKESIRVGVPAARRQRWVQSRYDAWLREMKRQRNPATIRREIERKLQYFRTAFDWVATTLRIEDGDLRWECSVSAVQP